MGRVQMTQPCIAEGRFRFVYKGEMEDEPGAKVLVKVFKEGCPMEVAALQPDLDVLERASELAKRWNREVVPRVPGTPRLAFQRPSVGHHVVDDASGAERYRQGQLSLVEPLLPGHYRKFNANAGWESGEYVHQAAGAFSHWTFDVTHHRYLVCDLQGVKRYRDGPGWYYRLSDPCVHSFDQEHRAALTDLGVVGMEMVLAGHSCGALCRALRLARPPVPRYLARPHKYTSLNTAEDLSDVQRERAAKGQSPHIRLGPVQEEDEGLDDLVHATGRFGL